MNKNSAVRRLSLVARCSRSCRWSLLSLLGVGLSIGSLHAQSSVVPVLISYQGRVTAANGTLVGDPTPVNRLVTFRIWNHASDALPANLIYAESQTATIAGGEFSVMIGQGTALSTEAAKGPPNLKLSDAGVFGGAVRYLGVTVDDGTGVYNVEISPRQQIVTSAYAFRAKYAETVGANGASTITATDTGNVGIGTASPGAKLDVAGGIKASGANGYTFSSGDADGGIFSPADNTITFFTNNAERMRLVGSNLGIGVTDPQTALEVNGSITASTSGGFTFRNDADTGMFTTANDSNILSFKTAGAEKLRIDLSGRVGIGRSDPAHTLDIRAADPTLMLSKSDATGGAIYFGNTAHGVKRSWSSPHDVGMFTSGADLYLSAAGATNYTQFVLKNAGNVGIGTTAPSDKLTVNGNVRAYGTNAALVFANSSNVIKGQISVAHAATNFSSDAAAGDVVIRAESGSNLLLVSGAGNSALQIATDNKVKVGAFTGGVLSDGLRTTHAQGAHLEWNKFSFLGRTYLLNQKGTGVGGITFGEVDTANNVTDTMRISAAGKVDVISGSTTLQLLPGQLYGTANAAAATLEIPGIATIAIWDNLAVDGKVAIGSGMTAPTDAFVHINGSVDKSGLTGAYINSDIAGNRAGHGSHPMSLRTSGGIWAGGTIISTSDERVKQVQGRSDGAKDLQTMMGIEVTDYRYKDTIGSGNGLHKKVVAQQVEKVYPQAVNERTGAVPDIFQETTVGGDGWVSLATNLKKGDRVRLIGEKKDDVFEVLEAAADQFRTEFTSTTGKVFVFGREVKDFRTVDYDALSMLNLSATQEIKREKDAEVKALRDENAALRTRLATLEARDKARDARFAAIEQLLRNATGVVARPAAPTGANGQD